MKPIAFCRHCDRLVPVLTGGRITEFERHDYGRVQCPGSGRAETYDREADAKPWTTRAASMRPR